MRKPESDKQNQQKCKRCGRIVGCDYHGRKHKCGCNQEDEGMIECDCNNCKKLGETTCGNEIAGRCFEPIEPESESDDNYDIQSI